MRVNTGMTAWEDGSMSLTLRSITFFHSANEKKPMEQAQTSLLFF